jgi:hypothetical protein
MPATGTKRLRTLAVVIGPVAVCAGWVWAAPQAPAEVETLMARVGAHVAEYYRRAQGVLCVEQSTVQPIQSNLAPAGFSRTVESELRVESTGADGDSLSDARMIRDIRRVNGRAPRARDQKDRAGCTDPNPLSPEPLAFLLPEHREEYRFMSLRNGKEKNRAALIVEFMSTNRTSKPELIEDEHGHDDCFDWSGPVATRGRVWVDATTYDVLRVDRRIDGLVDVRVPSRLQDRYHLAPWVVIERDDQTMRYTTVAFRDPDDLMLLPESIESLTVLRGGLQSIRRTQTFSSYRRFLTGGWVVKEP